MLAQPLPLGNLPQSLPYSLTTGHRQKAFFPQQDEGAERFLVGFLLPSVCCSCFQLSNVGEVWLRAGDEQSSNLQPAVTVSLETRLPFFVSFLILFGYIHMSTNEIVLGLPGVFEMSCFLCPGQNLSGSLTFCPAVLRLATAVAPGLGRVGACCCETMCRLPVVPPLRQSSF